jgi:hypothetical protein
MPASETKIVHHHIYKCAGTTFSSILQGNFPSRVFHVEGEDADVRIEGRDIQPCINLKKWSAVSSHLLTLPAPGQALAPLHVVLLRDPLARFQSAFRYEKKISHIRADMSFTQWMAGLSEIIAENFQVRCCSQQKPEHFSRDGGWFADFDSIDLAREDVFYGSVEQFDQSMVLLELRAKRLGIDFNAAYARPMNQSSRKGGKAKDSEEFSDLKRKNQLDYALLDAVMEKIRVESAQEDPQGGLLQAYRERCAAMSTHRAPVSDAPLLSQWSWIRPRYRWDDKRPLKKGASALLDRHRSRIWVHDWGPKHARAGNGFHIQANGNSTFWATGRNLSAVARFYLGENILSSVLSRADGELLSVQVPADMIVAPGEYEFVAENKEGACYPLGCFRIVD